MTCARAGDPANGEILTNLGAAHRAAGRPDQAVEVLHQTISLASENPSAYFNLANAYVDVGNNDIALQTYRQVIELVPNHVSAHRTVAQILRDAGDTNGALHEFEILDTLSPDTPETLNAIAVLHAGSGRLETAEEFLRRAVSLSPDNHEFASNLANILARTFRTDKALTLYQGALDNTPNDPDLLCNVGNAVSHRGENHEAVQKYQRALEIDPDHVDAHAGLANNLLADGQFANGWKHFLRLTSVLAIASHIDGAPFASNLDGTRVTVIADQGLGDQVFFARYIPALKARGARVTFQHDPRIADMLRRAGIADEIVPAETPADGDLIVSPGDLPFLLGSEDVDPTPVPYEIPALTEREEILRSKLTEFGPPPMGRRDVACRDTQHAPVASERSSGRSFCVGAARRTSTVIVVERDAAEGETDRFTSTLGRPVLDLSALNEEIENLLALSGLLARYVGVSNTMTHLRAARQKSSDVIVPRPAEYRWMNTWAASP